jgi:cell division protein ZapB
MEAEIVSLEQKIELLISKYAAVQAENRNLRDQIAALEAAQREINDRLGVASSRVEALIARLPELNA